MDDTVYEVAVLTEYTSNQEALKLNDAAHHHQLGTTGHYTIPNRNENESHSFTQQLTRYGRNDFHEFSALNHWAKNIDNLHISDNNCSSSNNNCNSNKNGREISAASNGTSNIKHYQHHNNVEIAQRVSRFSSSSFNMSISEASEAWVSEPSWYFDRLSNDAHHTGQSMEISDDVFMPTETDDRLGSIEFRPISSPSAYNEAMDILLGVKRSDEKAPPESQSASNLHVTGNSQQDEHLEEMLARVANDLCALGKNQEPSSQLSEIDSRPNNSARNGLVSESSELSAESMEFFSAKSEMSDCDVYKTAQGTVYEMETNESSGISTCRTSKVSSQSNRIEISENISEDNMADVESCEGPLYMGEKRFKRKMRDSASLKHPAVVRQNLPEPKNTLWKKYDNSDCMGVSDSHTGNETDTERNSSGYCDNISVSSFKSDSETSVLNPHSKPFVPRAYRHISYLPPQNVEPEHFPEHLGYFNHLPPSQMYTDASERQPYHSHFDMPSDSSNIQTYNGDMLMCDSGFANATDLAHSWNMTANSTFPENCMGTFNDSAFPRATPQKSRILHMLSKTRDYETTACESSYRDFPKVELPPYNCKLQHEDEFIPIQSLTTQKLPQKMQKMKNLEVIQSISQRVVRLKVHKTFSATLHSAREHDFKSNSNARHNLMLNVNDPDPEDPVLDHYGTGFAYFVDREYIEVRTHSEIVGNAEEAKSTEVTFVITFPGGSQSQPICCNGITAGFSTIKHSQTSIFRCKTPPQLVPYMYLFKDVPYEQRLSLFEDSCYFTDSSPDTSASEATDNQPETKFTSVDSSSDIKNQTTGSLANMFTVSTDNTHACQTVGDLETAAVLDRKTSFVLGDKLEGKVGMAQSVNLSSNNNSSSISTQSTVTDLQLNINDQHTVNTKDHNDFANLNQSGHHNIRTDNENFNQESDTPQTYHVSHNNLASNRENPFAYCGAEESLVRHAFESADACIGSSDFLPVPKYSKEESDTQSCFREPSALHRIVKSEKQKRASSPLAIMENRWEKRQQTTDRPTCPYAGQNIFGQNGLYTYFSSYAGDILSSAINSSNCSENVKTDTDKEQGHWEYESLVYAQSYFRHLYNRLYRVDPQWDIPSAVDSAGDQPVAATKHKAKGKAKRQAQSESSLHIPSNTSQATVAAATKSGQLSKTSLSMNQNQMEAPSQHVTVNGKAAEHHDKAKTCDVFGTVPSTPGAKTSPTKPSKDIFEDYSSVDTYLETWDRDLLNLDEQLNPLPEYGFFENVVDLLVSDEPDYNNSYLHKTSSSCCCPFTNINPDVSSQFSVGKLGKYFSEASPSYALIISHPHGGSKMVSSGLFSRHYHVGGSLYDTPTCMGCCGAPIIALSEHGDAPYVTHLVHAGTVRVNDIATGAGVMYF